MHSDHAAKLRDAVRGARHPHRRRRGHRRRVPAARRARAGARRRRRRARRARDRALPRRSRSSASRCRSRPRGTPFQRRVWEAIAAIPPGESRTYGEVARSCARRRAPSGSACGANPIALVIPCHRVVGSQGRARRIHERGRAATRSRSSAGCSSHEGYRFGAGRALTWRCPDRAASAGCRRGDRQRRRRADRRVLRPGLAAGRPRARRRSRATAATSTRGRRGSARAALLLSARRATSRPGSPTSSAPRRRRRRSRAGCRRCGASTRCSCSSDTLREDPDAARARAEAAAAAAEEPVRGAGRGAARGAGRRRRRSACATARCWRRSTRRGCACPSWSGLKLAQVSLDMGVVRVLGKGSKERLVPLGEEAIDWLKRYLATDARRRSPATRKSDALFVTARRGPLTRQAFWALVKRYAVKAGIPRRARCRRTCCATRSRRTSSTTAPTCASSSCCSATPTSRRRRSTRTSRASG